MRGMNTEQQYVAVAMAGKMTGIPERTIRHWVTTGKLSAIAGERGRLVRLEDVHRIAIMTGKLPGPLPTEMGAATLAGNPASGVGNVADGSTIVEVSASTNHQLEVIRDTLLRPLIEQNERQQERIAEQAETIGRIAAEVEHERQRAAAAEVEHDELREVLRRRAEAAESRLSALEVQQVESPDEPENAAPEAVRLTWWRRWFG